MMITLANPEGRLPWPDVPGRILTGGEIVEINPDHPFWRACLKDGSILPATPPAPPAGKSPKE